MRPPIVTDKDRDWALAQCPSWAARRGSLEDEALDIVDDDKPLDLQDDDWRDTPPNWDMFVAEEIEKFERFFMHERKDPDDWSRLWRYGWWPKANPERRFPIASRASAKAHPFWRPGHPDYQRAYAMGTAIERKVWTLAGVVQFKPDDPRVARMSAPVKKKASPARGKMQAAGDDL